MIEQFSSPQSAEENELAGWRRIRRAAV